MKRILVFAGSNSSKSINKELALYAANLLDGVELNVIDIADYELPLYGIDLEKKFGVPKAAFEFVEQIQKSDGIILSLADHNGAYTAAFKNLLDWMSRADSKLWNEKPMLLMATSPGQRGGTSVLEMASSRFPYLGAQIVDTFSLPNFHINFKNGELLDSQYREELKEKVDRLSEAIFEYAI